MIAPLLFSPEMNWEDPLVEEREYETAIFAGFDDTETRQGVRPVPNRRLTYTIRSLDLRESGLLEALIHHGQGVVCWVPYWRKAAYLQADVALGDTFIPLTDGHNAGFQSGEGAMLYRDFHTAEAVNITGVGDGGLTVSDVNGTWNGTTRPGDRIVPLFRGRLSQSTDLDYLAREAKDGPVTFDLGLGTGESGLGTDGGDGEFPTPCGATIEDPIVGWTFASNDFNVWTQCVSEDDPCATLFPCIPIHSGKTLKYLGGADGSGGGGSTVTIEVPPPEICVPTQQTFHRGAYFYHDVTGLTPHVTYECSIQFTAGGFTDPSFWGWYDTGLFQPGGTSDLISLGSEVSGVLTIRDIPRYASGTTFRIAVGWSFLAYFTISTHTILTFGPGRFIGPCS